MQKNCCQCRTQFEITPEDQGFYQKIDVPEPKTCPKCRLIRRLQERNIRKLYYRKCDYSGEKIISQYHAGVPFPVYKPEIWWSDQWDSLQYGRDFDFTRPFFEQFKELKRQVPHQGLYVINGTMENSEYTTCTGYLKNCYLIFESDYDEDCYYSNLLKNSKNLMDCSICYQCELCYECVDCMGCYNIQYSQDCQNCQDSSFLKDCSGCQNCIGCINQKHKQYMIFNQQYSKEEYEKMKASMGLDDAQKVEALAKKCEDFFQTQTRKPLEEENNQNCLGNHIYNSKNASYCFDSKDLEDCKYCVKVSLGVKSSMDYNSWGNKAELIYQTASSGDNIYNLKFCTNCTTNLSNCEYCDGCSKSSELFGCVGVKGKKYCILNKQYSKKEYELLRDKIIEHMKKNGEYGEYFPNDMCPFGYNETIAMTYYPLTEEEALAKGYQWAKKESVNRYQGSVTNLPDKIQGIQDSITQFILTCRDCGKNYRIISQELKFYQKLGLPPAKNCPDCRYEVRMQKRSPLEFWKRKCLQCGEETLTTFSPEKNEKVVCKKCYLKAVY